MADDADIPGSSTSVFDRNLGVRETQPVHQYPPPEYQRSSLPYHALHTPSSRNWGPPKQMMHERRSYRGRPFDPKYGRR